MLFSGCIKFFISAYFKINVFDEETTMYSIRNIGRVMPAAVHVKNRLQMPKGIIIPNTASIHIMPVIWRRYFPMTAWRLVQ